MTKNGQQIIHKMALSTQPLFAANIFSKIQIDNYIEICDE